MQIIQHIELGSAQANITFSSIPQTYTDLYLSFSARTNRPNDYGDVAMIRPNASTTGLSSRRLYGLGSSVASALVSWIAAGQCSTTAQTSNTFGNATCYIPNYTSSNAKSFSADGVAENNGTNAIQELDAGLWTGTSAITSLVLLPELGTQFESGSSFTLFGILKGSSGGVTVS